MIDWRYFTRRWIGRLTSSGVGLVFFFSKWIIKPSVNSSTKQNSVQLKTETGTMAGFRGSLAVGIFLEPNPYSLPTTDVHIIHNSIVIGHCKTNC